ncbi:dTMP kinase, partial [Streptomonospora wellingtoniae]
MNWSESMDGLFISFEGPEGAGKTTQIRRICEWLDHQGISYIHVREPGGTRIGNEIRELVLHPEFDEMSMLTEVLLYASSRAQLVGEVIMPALAEGKMVLCDRYVDSSVAYQSYGAG